MMIELKDLSYVRMGASNLEEAESFATKCLGLQIGEQSGNALYLRSDDRAHTLCYFEGDPAEQTVGFEVEDESKLNAAAATLDQLGHPVHAGTPTECTLRKVKAFIGFKDPTGNQIELVVRPERSGKRYFASRDAGITGFSHVGLHTTDPARDEKFWTQVCNARVNHQVESNDDVLRSFYHLSGQRVPIVFGPGRHPTSGARFLYFQGPDGMVFEYSVGVDEIEDEATHRPRQFGFEPSSLCMWGSKSARPR